MVGGIRPSAGVVLLLLPPALLHYTINRRKLQAVRQKICAKKAKMLGGVPCAAPVRPAAVENSMGSLPRRCRRGGRQRYPAGGLPGWSPAYPAFTFFSAPYPPIPLPQRGRGRPRLFHARGSAPCIRKQKISPFPPGRGQGGWGQESKLKARLAGSKQGKPPRRGRQGQVDPSARRQMRKLSKQPQQQHLELHLLGNFTPQSFLRKILKTSCNLRRIVV